MKNDAELFTGNQQGIPGMEYKSGNWKSVAFIADLYGVSEQSIRDWIDASIIEAPINRLLNVIEVIRAVYRHQRNLVERMGSKPLTDERLKVTTIKREISELELKKLRGELMHVEKIKRIAFARAKTEAEILNSLPSRLKSILAAESDEFKVGQVLQSEIEQIAKKTIEMSKSE